MTAMEATPAAKSPTVLSRACVHKNTHKRRQKKWIMPPGNHQSEAHAECKISEQDGNGKPERNTDVRVSYAAESINFLSKFQEAS